MKKLKFTPGDIVRSKANNFPYEVLSYEPIGGRHNGGLLKLRYVGTCSSSRRLIPNPYTLSTDEVYKVNL